MKWRQPLSRSRAASRSGCGEGALFGSPVRRRSDDDEQFAEAVEKAPDAAIHYAGNRLSPEQFDRAAERYRVMLSFRSGSSRL